MKEGPPITSQQAPIESQELARIVLGCLTEGKAEDLKTLDVAQATILADYFIIASVKNTRQASAIADAINTELKKRGHSFIGCEGRNDGWWVLLDFGDVIVHIMQPEARAFYDLDSYWGDSPEVALEPIRPLYAAG